MNNAYEFLYSKSARLGFGSWQVEKTLYKHSAGVTALVLHPSGKLAFSVAKDKKIITWNLVVSHVKVNFPFHLQKIQR